MMLASLPTRLSGYRLIVAVDAGRVTASNLRKTRPAIAHSTGASREEAALMRDVRDRVAAYFSRDLDRFDLPVRLDGSPFEVLVWNVVAELRFGEIASYADVARAAGHPRGHRGVAAALAKAPLDLFVPAHRVIGSDGKIKGAAPGSVRERLLRFEREPKARL